MSGDGEPTGGDEPSRQAPAVEEAERSKHHGTLIFVIVTSTIGGLQIFTEPKLFEPSGGSGGGAEHQYQTVVLYLYQSAFQGLDLGYASAIAWVLFLIVIAVAGLNFWLTRRAVR